MQESGPDQVETKQALLEQIGAALGPEVVIASSSSNLMPSAIQARCPHPERVIVAHPFNPPHLIPLVEVCGGAQTAPEVVDRAVRFYRAIGKHPIRLKKEMPGHVSNRLQAAIWREAAYLVEQGVVDVTDVDAAVAQGPGIRWALMGPMLTHHLGRRRRRAAALVEEFRPGDPVAASGRAGGQPGAAGSAGRGRRAGGGRNAYGGLGALARRQAGRDPAARWGRSLGEAAAAGAAARLRRYRRREAAEVHVLTAGAFKPVLDALVPAYSTRAPATR